MRVFWRDGLKKSEVEELKEGRRRAYCRVHRETARLTETLSINYEEEDGWKDAGGVGVSDAGGVGEARGDVAGVAT
jgi:hypothetical protein